MALGEKTPARVHGPCERCGALFYSEKTGCQATCPNCGHRPSCED